MGGVPHHPRLFGIALTICAIALTAAAPASSLVAQQDANADADSLDHRRLDRYRDAAGRLRPIETVDDWLQRRAQILAGFQQAIGDLPSRDELPPLDLRIKDSEERESYTRHRVDFVSATEDRDRIPAYLYLPAGSSTADRRAGIVALHPTHKIGKDVVDGQSERPNRAYARELAQRGHVVVAPDYLSFGEYAGYEFGADRYPSGTLKGIWNHMRCVDLLQSLDEVDGDRIGAIGHSLGGHNAIFLGVMDERVRVVVSSCGWTPFHDYYGGRSRAGPATATCPRCARTTASIPTGCPSTFPS